MKKILTNPYINYVSISAVNNMVIGHVLWLQFLGRFEFFENRPLDPVFYFLSKLEAQ